MAITLTPKTVKAFNAHFGTSFEYKEFCRLVSKWGSVDYSPEFFNTPAHEKAQMATYYDWLRQNFTVRK